MPTFESVPMESAVDGEFAAKSGSFCAPSGASFFKSLEAPDMFVLAADAYASIEPVLTLRYAPEAGRFALAVPCSIRNVFRMRCNA